MQRARHYQNDTSASFGYSRQQSNGFQPMSFDASRIPVEVASIITDLSSNISQHISRDEPDHASNAFSIPDINSGNLNVSLDGQMPQELMRSVMGMFSGAAQRGTGQNNPSACD
uniref:Uncharacterized protein n=1 Tax=Kalanchoe fedtschenkoi TaxID=63787 RepID=A0A7N0UQ07_KALFE